MYYNFVTDFLFDVWFEGCFLLLQLKEFLKAFDSCASMLLFLELWLPFWLEMLSLCKLSWLSRPGDLYSIWLFCSFIQMTSVFSLLTKASSVMFYLCLLPLDLPFNFIPFKYQCINSILSRLPNSLRFNDLTFSFRISWSILLDPKCLFSSLKSSSRIERIPLWCKHL